MLKYPLKNQQEQTADETIKTIIERGHRPNDKIVFDKDPKNLIQKIVELVKKEEAQKP